MKYVYNITFYYSPKCSLACKEGGRQTSHLLREEKNKIKKKFSKHKKIVQKECKRVLKENDYEGKKISELKKLNTKTLADLNEKIDKKIN